MTIIEQTILGKKVQATHKDGILADSHFHFVAVLDRSLNGQ